MPKTTAKKTAMQRFSDEAVKAKTGKTWAEWYKILNAAGARKMTHMQRAKYIYDNHGKLMWWSQMIAVGYEQHYGLRVVGETCTGDFAAGCSRMVAAPAAKAYSAWTDEKLRKRWLPAGKLEITTATPGKSLRGAWDGNKSRLSVYFYPKGASRCQVVVDHMKLSTERERNAMKKYWADAMDRFEKAVA